MGLFLTVLHLYQKKQEEIVDALSKTLAQDHGLSRVSRIAIDNSNHENVLKEQVFSQGGVFYLVTQPHGNWTTVIELAVARENPFYLYDLTTPLSKRLGTYALSFYVHDSDVLLYNLDRDGETLDGYNSNYQHFLTDPAPRDEVLSQRHTPDEFVPILPASKDISSLNSILNVGYWQAFDRGEFDEDGVPIDDDSFLFEEDRLKLIGQCLEIYSKDEYPFANWEGNLLKFDLPNCYLLKAE